MKKLSFRLLLFSIVSSFLLLTGYALKAQNYEVDEQLFRSVAIELRCPTCQGLSILDSTANFSEQIKAQVREQIRQGKNKDEIIAFFVERYGPWILREPPKEGFNLIAWILPTVILILGPILIWFFVWRKRRQIESYGVRSVDAIVEEMNKKLEALKRGKPA